MRRPRFVSSLRRFVLTLNGHLPGMLVVVLALGLCPATLQRAVADTSLGPATPLPAGVSPGDMLLGELNCVACQLKPSMPWFIFLYH